jgi:hypothetical protein
MSRILFGALIVGAVIVAIAVICITKKDKFASIALRDSGPSGEIRCQNTDLTEQDQKILMNYFKPGCAVQMSAAEMKAAIGSYAKGLALPPAVTQAINNIQQDNNGSCYKNLTMAIQPVIEASASYFSDPTNLSRYPGLAGLLSFFRLWFIK